MTATTMTKEVKVNRGYTISIKAKSGEVEGLFSIFGNVDGGADRTAKGSMVASLAAKLPVFLWMHDPYQVAPAVVLEAYEVGRDALPNSVKSQYPEATGGAYVKRRYYLETPLGQQLMAALSGGSPLGMSFGYSVQNFRIGPDGVRDLLKVTVLDISDVTYGMNEGAVSNLALAKGYKFKQGTAPRESGWSEAAMLQLGWLKPNEVKHISRRYADMLYLGVITPEDYLRKAGRL